MTADLPQSHLLQDDQYHWQNLLAEIEASRHQFDQHFQQKLQKLAIASSYALHQLCREPSLLSRLDGLKQFDLKDYKVCPIEADQAGIEAQKKSLRRYRHQKLIEIIYLDVVEACPLEDTLGHLSNLADLLISEALTVSQNYLATKHGQPLDEAGEKMELNIIAMGKLGGRELNFSSDIDLICAYPGDGELDGYGHLSYQEFFARVTRLFAQLLNDGTEDGFVYRVDLRLRPWGDSGPVALSHAAIEHYYQLHGRDWEQYAMVKARVLTGSAADKNHLQSIINPFVYRKYHDYRVFEGLASLKDKINLQARSRGMRDNLKLGYGGIREIEFFVQAFQILKGGRNQQLQASNIFTVFEVLLQQAIVDAATVTDLHEAYVFLRQLENKIQMLGDEQTHDCPDDRVLQERLAETMGYADWSAVAAALKVHRDKVNSRFGDLFKRETETETEISFVDAGEDEASEMAQLEFLESIGLTDPTATRDRINRFYASKAWRFTSAKAKNRFAVLLPRILKVLAHSQQQLPLLERLLNLFSSIAGRSVYFELLYQNTALLEKLVGLFDKSEWIAQEVASYPMLLEHLIQAGDPAERFNRMHLQQNLQTQLDNVVGDEELELDVLRLFKRDQTLVIAVAELSDEISSQQVGIYLSELAETVLDAVHRLARRKLQEQYGLPQWSDGETERVAEFAIVGYGKLGGSEMHYQSDLDVIFLHSSGGNQQQTSGPRIIDNAMFFARLAQKIISMTSVLTASGKLYEIDSRLRPEGSSGLLVSSLSAYREYQLNKAWTWEHQALIRARYVAGSRSFEEAFKSLRVEILSQAREPNKLRREIFEMREKMYRAKNPPEGEFKNLKHSRGCMVDIEFLVQYWTLLNANKVASILTYSDNIGLLNELFRLQLISGSQFKLADIYQTYHHCLHETVLQNRAAEIDSESIAAQVEHVITCWNQSFGELLEKN